MTTDLLAREMEAKPYLQKNSSAVLAGMEKFLKHGLGIPA